MQYLLENEQSEDFYFANLKKVILKHGLSFIKILHQLINGFQILQILKQIAGYGSIKLFGVMQTPKVE